MIIEDIADIKWHKNLNKGIEKIHQTHMEKMKKANLVVLKIIKIKGQGGIFDD